MVFGILNRIETLARLLLYGIVIGAFVVGCHPSTFCQDSSSSTRETATVSGVRKELHGSFLCTTRYSRIHDFDVYFSLRIGQQTYCGDYETTVLDEVRDLVNSDGQNLEVSLAKKKQGVTLYIHPNRKLKARIVESNHCTVPVAQSR